MDWNQKVIAAKLFIAKGTLHKHLANIRKKLGVRSIVDVVRLQQIMMVKAVSTLRFSPRGREVFMLVRDGLTGNQIATRLNIGVSCVRRHKEKMLLQNDCATMLELIAKYHGMGS